MAIARLDTAASAAAATLDYSVSAGTDRCLIVCTGHEVDGQITVDSVSYGGQAMEQIAQIDSADTGFSAGVSAWFLDDAGIAAASGTTITPTYSATPADEVIHAASYTGVNQVGGSTSFPQTATFEQNESTPNPNTTIDLTETDNGLIGAVVGMGNAGLSAWQSDMTEQTDQAALSSQSSYADRLSTTNANVTIEDTLATPNRVAGLSFELAQSGAALVKVINETIGIIFRNRDEGLVAWILPVSPIGITESVNQLVEAVGGIIKVIDETVGITEAKNSLLNLVRNIESTIGITESKNSLLNLVRNINSTVGITESSNRLKVIGAKVIDEIVGITEDTNRLMVIGAKVIDETVGITEARNSLQFLVRNIESTIGITETKNSLLNLVRVIDSTVGITEASNRLMVIGAKVIDEIVGITEDKNRLLGFVKVIDETVGITEARNSLISLVQVIDEIVGITETKNSLQNLVRNINSTVGITESRNSLLSLVRVIDETVGITELSNRLKVIGAKVIDEIVGITETINSLITTTVIIKVIDEIVGIIEAKNRLRNLVRVINESVGIIENIVRIGGELAAKLVGGGLSKVRRLKQYMTDIFPVTGQLLLKDNLDLIAKITFNESFDTKGKIIYTSVIEAVGKLGLKESLKLNAKLRVFDSFKIKNPKDYSVYKLLMDILDDI